MRIKAVIDTNVLVASLITSTNDAPTVKVINYIFDNTIIPLYSEEIMTEYVEVLSRSKFAIKQYNIGNLINVIKEKGIKVKPAKINIELLDEDVLPFYEVVMEKKKWRIDVGNWQYKTLSRESVYSNTKRNGWFNRAK